MNPHIFVYGSLIFFICLALHVFIWRIKIPDNDALILFLIFLIIPTLIFLILLGLRSFMTLMPISGVEMAHALLLHLSLSLVYISSYPAAQAISPTLDILLVIAASGAKKLTKEEIIKNYDNKKLVTISVDSLKTSVLISQEGDRVRLTNTGRIIINFFIFYRRILGLPVGEG